MALVKDLKVGDTLDLPGIGQIKLGWKSGQRVKLHFDLKSDQEVRIIPDPDADATLGSDRPERRCEGK